MTKRKTKKAVPAGPIDPELVDDLDAEDGDDIEPVELPEYDHTPFAVLPEDFDEDYDGEES